MITAYVHSGDRLMSLPLELGDRVPAGTVWLDVLRPSDPELLQCSECLGVTLPTKEDMSEIEASSRLYVENDTAFMTTPVVSRNEMGQPDLGLLTFVLKSGLLVTVRHTEPLWFATFAARTLKHPQLAAEPVEVMLGLLEAVVDRVADVLELVGGRLDRMSHTIFAEATHDAALAAAPTAEPRSLKRPPRRVAKAKPLRSNPDALKTVITGIGAAGDLTHKVRDCLAGLERLCAFAVTVAGPRMTKEQKARLKTIARDIHSLVEHAAFQAHQTNFLLDATLGVIDIQQTNIIKIFSVAAVAFLPPTLIASIYGMNFKYMPELAQEWGYPLALVLMVAAAVLPLLYFRRKGWL